MTIPTKEMTVKRIFMNTQYRDASLRKLWIVLVQRGSNTHRISAALFGSFGLVIPALRQQGCVFRIQNPSNISRRNVQSSFAGADFRPDEKLDAGNTWCIAKDNCEVWAEIRPSKPIRVRSPLD